MATIAQLEEGLKRAYGQGNMQYARILANELVQARKETANLIPGTQVPGTAGTTAEPTLGEQALGAGETALTLATGATGGTVGMLAGTASGMAEQILSGNFGTPEAQRAVEASAMKGAQALTYQPRTVAGQEQVAAIGEVAAAIPPVLPVAAELTTLAQPGAQAVRAAAAPAAAAVRRTGAAAQSKLFDIKEALAERAAQSRGVSVGAAATPEAMRLTETAAQLPVPLAGASTGLTKGQSLRASGDFAQLQFEKEAAKLGELGAPLRERHENQAAAILQNFDALIEQARPLTFERRDIGGLVTKALEAKANIARRKIKDAYTKAREAGETAEPITMEPLAKAFADAAPFEGLVPTVATVRREAQRIGAITPNSDGSLAGAQITLGDSEMLRQFVNEATDWSNKREAMVSRKLTAAIDEATEGKGGELYKRARALHKQYVEEFENTGLTAQLMGTKRGTTQRKVALEDVFDKIVLLSPLDETNKLRRTLLTAGTDGKQAWQDLKAAGINHIKESALSASQTDARGTPILSVDKLARTIARLDEEKKLESLYGRKRAQQLRDISEIAKAVYTAPPGAVNYSGTASALRVALDSVATFGITGIPAPIATALREASKYVRDRKTRARIIDALKPTGGQ